MLTRLGARDLKTLKLEGKKAAREKKLAKTVDLGFPGEVDNYLWTEGVVSGVRSE